MDEQQNNDSTRIKICDINDWLERISLGIFFLGGAVTGILIAQEIGFDNWFALIFIILFLGIRHFIIKWKFTKKTFFKLENEFLIITSGQKKFIEEKIPFNLIRRVDLDIGYQRGLSKIVLRMKNDELKNFRYVYVYTNNKKVRAFCLLMNELLAQKK